MSVTIGGTTFDRVNYDAGADVLYLHVGDPEDAVAFDESPESHGLRFGADGRLVGVTIVGLRRQLEEDGRLVITLPAQVEVRADELAAIINAA